MAIKVAILGFGEEGRAAYAYFARQGAEITIFDEAPQPKYEVPQGVAFVHGPDAFAQLMGFDKVLRGSPAIRPDRIQTDGEITSVTKEFFAACPSTNIIGVTGTKGKGTISTLAYDILKEAGLTAHLAGNVGVPMLAILDEIRPDDVIVLELSSFQLWDIEVSPHVAVVGMIEPEHLEVHKDMAEYVAAKARIARFQAAEDVIIYHPTNEYSASIAQQSAGRKVRYNTAEGAYVKDGALFVGEQEIMAISRIKIPGHHNVENICAAVTAAWQFTQSVEAVRRAVSAFAGLEHRLEFVREVDGVSYYNDSIATTVGSVAAAIKAFEPAHELLVIGGRYDKGIDFAELAIILARMQPKRVLFVGPIGAKIATLAAAQGYTRSEVYEEWTMSDIVQRAAALSEAGDVVILSPATASFGDFTNYKARGQQFKDTVQSL